MTNKISDQLKKPDTMIPINKPWIDEDERREVLNVLDDNALTSPAREGGKRVQDFERLMKSFLGSKYVIATNSGTAALHAALLALNIKQDDEVLLPSFTFVATANSVIATGARPVFVDINKEDFTIDIKDLQSKLSPKTKAIIPVHLYGHPCDMEQLHEISQENAIPIVEDACQSLGSKFKDKQTGTFGSMGCFSLYASKVLTSGEGGAVATDDDDLADKLKMIRNHGMVEGYDTRIFGLNLRLPELSAAVAKSQMKKLSRMLEMRRKNALLLSNYLQDSENEKLKIPKETANKKYNWYLYTVVIKDNKRDIVKRKLTESMIGATVYYNPSVHKTPYYSSISQGTVLPNTDFCAERVLSLPVHPLVTEAEIEYIAKNLKNNI
jgi:dTDP-4-amino-4,6-dideoxygalactose transaminase